MIFSGTVQIWYLVVIEALFGTAEAFFRPAATGLLPQTVPEADIQQANGLSTLSNNFAQFAGPALATALVLGLGAGWAFALDAGTFLLSAAFLARVRPRRREAPATVAEPSTRTTVRSEIREGFREVRARAWVGERSQPSVSPCFAGSAPGSCSVQSSRVSSITTSVSTAWSLRRSASARSGIAPGDQGASHYPMRSAMFAILLWPLAAVMYAAGVTLFIVIPITVIAGSGIALFDVWWLTALAERIPADRLSRVSSYDWMVSLALPPLGYALAGPLADVFGAVAVLLGGSALACIALGVGLLPRETRMLKRDDGSEPVATVKELLPGLDRMPYSAPGQHCAPIIISPLAFISFQTAAEVRYGALRPRWGESRILKLEARPGHVELVHSGLELIQVYARLRAACADAGYPLAQREHNADRWVAATALRLGVPLVSNDGILRGVPGPRGRDCLLTGRAGGAAAAKRDDEPCQLTRGDRAERSATATWMRVRAGGSVPGRRGTPA